MPIVLPADTVGVEAAALPEQFDTAVGQRRGDHARTGHIYRRQRDEGSRSITGVRSAIIRIVIRRAHRSPKSPWRYRSFAWRSGSLRP